MRCRVISWLAMAGAVSLLAACGSSSSSHGNSTPAVTPAHSPSVTAYIARGDRICRKGNTAIAPVYARVEAHHGGTRREARLIASAMHAGLRHYRRLYKRLARIAPPAHDTATVEKILSGLRRVGEDLQRLTRAIERRDTAAIRTITAEREMDHARVSALELEFGFKVCGQPSSGSPLSGEAGG